MYMLICRMYSEKRQKNATIVVSPSCRGCLLSLAIVVYFILSTTPAAIFHGMVGRIFPTSVIRFLLLWVVSDGLVLSKFPRTPCNAYG